MSSETDKKALLGQLRIDRSEPAASANSARSRWLIGAAVLLVAVLGGAWFMLDRKSVV